MQLSGKYTEYQYSQKIQLFKVYKNVDLETQAVHMDLLVNTQKGFCTVSAALPFFLHSSKVRELK